MEAYIIENPSVLELDLENFNDVTILDAEFTLEKAGSNSDKKGRIDILANYGQEYLAIIELKMGELTHETVKQLERYLKVRKQIAENPDVWDENNNEPKWIGVIVGASIEPNLALKIRKGEEIDGVPIAALTLRRFRGQDGNVYVITDTYFPQKVSGKDYTKYIYNGKTLAKNRLVLEVIKVYVESNPNISYSKLAEQFPHKLQGSETFTTIEDALAKKTTRNFIQPQDQIKLGEGTVIAVSNQWGLDSKGKGNLKNFLDRCAELGIEITKSEIK